MGGENYKVWSDPNKRRLYVRFAVGLSEHDLNDLTSDVRTLVTRLGTGEFDVVSDLRASPGIRPGMVARLAETIRWMVDMGLRRTVRVVTSEIVADQFDRVSRNIGGYDVEEVESLAEAERLLDGGTGEEAPVLIVPPPPDPTLASMTGPRKHKKLFSRF